MADESAPPSVTITLPNNEWTLIAGAMCHSDMPTKIVLPLLQKIQQAQIAAAKKDEPETPPLMQRMTGGKR